MIPIEIEVIGDVHPPVKGYLEDSGWDLFLPEAGYILSRETFTFTGRKPAFYGRISEILSDAIVIEDLERGWTADLNRSFYREDSSSGVIIPPNTVLTIPSGIRIKKWPFEKDQDLKIDAVIRERSSMPKKAGLIIVGGQIDYGYTGELHIQLANLSLEHVVVSAGTRIGQMVFRFVPIVVLYQGMTIKNSGPRGAGGLGSTGVS